MAKRKRFNPEDLPTDNRLRQAIDKAMFNTDSVSTESSFNHEPMIEQNKGIKDAFTEWAHDLAVCREQQAPTPHYINVTLCERVQTDSLSLSVEITFSYTTAKRQESDK